MKQLNAKNERIKREYFRYQTQAKQKSESTLNGIRKAIDRFESYINHKDFATFNKEQAIAFKKHIAKQRAFKSVLLLSKSTILSTVNSLKEFFQWIAYQPGYKSQIYVPDIEYFNLSDKEISIAKSPKLKSFPTIEQVRKVIFNMPVETVIQRRDRAIIAFAILTGMRDSAIATVRLKHINLTSDPVMIRQEPDEIKTKFSKQIFSHFLPVGDDIRSVVFDWLQELREKLFYGQNDPVFPKTKIGQNVDQMFSVQGLEPECWNTASPIRSIFKAAFADAGLPYFSPHRFRDTLVHFGQEICQTPEEFKAWSQTLGHTSPLTTFASYGQIDPYRQGMVIKNLLKESTDEKLPSETEFKLRKLAKMLKEI